MWEGSGKPQAYGFIDSRSLEDAINAWRKSAKFKTRVINIPNEKFAEVQGLLAQFDIKID